MNIYVGNLSFQSEENDLKPLFQEFGEVGSVKVIMDNFTNRSKGFGFVVMEDEDAARKAIATLNGTSLQGNILTVNESKPRPKDDSRGGGGGYRSNSNSGYSNNRSGGKRW